MGYTKFGEYLNNKAINRAEVARKTGLNKTRLAELATLERAKLRVDELKLISLAIGVDPMEILDYICSDIVLPKTKNPSI